MGREAECLVECGAERDETRVLLEAEGLVLRGSLKGTLRLADLKKLRVEGNALAAETPRGPLRVHLGAAEAQRWLERLQNPPSLAAKLGLKAGAKVVRLGPPDAELGRVLAEAGAQEVAAGQAELAFALVDSPAALQQLEKSLARLPPATPIWILRLKGKNVPVGESAIMAELKRLGYGPAKTARWSDERGADRYHRRS